MAAVSGEQPDIDEPVIAVGQTVLETADECARRGEIISIEDDNVVVIDFYDWIERVEKNRISCELLRFGFMLVRQSPGEIVVNFGLLETEEA